MDEPPVCVEVLGARGRSIRHRAVGEGTQASLAEVRRTLQSVQETLSRADRNLLDPSAPIQRNAEQTLLDLQRAAQSLRVLTDYLQRHPESLLRGKPDDAKIPATR